MKRCLFGLSSLLMFFITNLSFAQQKDFSKELKIIFEAFQNKDYELLKPLLDSKMKIGDLPTGMNDAIVPQIIKQLPKPSTYTVLNTVEEEGGTRVNTAYKYEIGITRPQSFKFDANHKIIDFDVLSGAQTMTATAPQPKANDMPDRFVVPFKIKKGILIVKAQLDGYEKNFIFDSGCPTLILNADAVDQNKVQKTSANAMGIGGTAALGMYHVRSFNWQGIKLNDLDAITLSIQHLEKATRTKIAGLIGYTLFSDYQITYDYANSQMIFERTDDNGDVVKPSNPLSASTPVVIPFEQAQHIPIFPVSVNGKTYQVGLDCGASGNLLQAKYYEDVVANDNIKKKRTTPMQGAGSEKVKVKTGVLLQVSVRQLTYEDMQFAFEDNTLEQLNNGYGLKLDGLFGYPFLKKHLTVVNYKKKEIRIFE